MAMDLWVSIVRILTPAESLQVVVESVQHLLTECLKIKLDTTYLTQLMRILFLVCILDMDSRVGTTVMETVTPMHGSLLWQSIGKCHVYRRK